MSPLKAGDSAPKFSLPDQDGEQVNLTDFWFISIPKR
jgi:peroxiredoxin Q/BCP